MEVPNLTGEALALYNFVQAQLQVVNNDITALRTSLQSAAAKEEMQQRFATTDQGINAMSQKIDASAQSTEMKLNACAAVVASGDLRGPPRKKDITESKPANKLKEFG